MRVDVGVHVGSGVGVDEAVGDSVGDGGRVGWDVAVDARVLGASAMASFVTALVAVGAVLPAHPLKANSRPTTTARRARLPGLLPSDIALFIQLTPSSPASGVGPWRCICR